MSQVTNPSAGAVQTATGTFVGNGGVARQIVTGFECSRVVLFRETPAVVAWSLVPGQTMLFPANGGNLVDDTANCYLHATNGFVVDNAGGSNLNALDYRWWAMRA